MLNIMAILHLPDAQAASSVGASPFCYLERVIRIRQNAEYGVTRRNAWFPSLYISRRNEFSPVCRYFGSVFGYRPNISAINSARGAKFRANVGTERAFGL